MTDHAAIKNLLPETVDASNHELYQNAGTQEDAGRAPFLFANVLDVSSGQDLTNQGLLTVFPAGVGALIPLYRLAQDDQVDVPLFLDVRSLVDIYRGKITRWDDPAIQDLNPKRSFDNHSICVVISLACSLAHSLACLLAHSLHACRWHTRWHAHRWHAC